MYYTDSQQNQQPLCHSKSGRKTSGHSDALVSHDACVIARFSQEAYCTNLVHSDLARVCALRLPCTCATHRRQHGFAGGIPSGVRLASTLSYSLLSYSLLYGTSMVTPHAGLRCRCESVRYFLTIGMLIGTLASCGYTLVGVPPNTPGHRLPLTILPFTNQTREPDLERLTTAALRHAIVQSQIFSFAADDTSARRLHGAIRRFRSIPLALDAQDNVVQYRIEADMHIRLIEAVTQH